MAWLLLLLLVAAALPPVRTRCYELFRALHWLVLPIAVFSSIHMANSFFFFQVSTTSTTGLALTRP